METHKDIDLSCLRKYIIRYGAKYMEAYESDLFYDCEKVAEMKDGDELFWMVSGMHTHLYSAKYITDFKFDVSNVVGDRFNYRIVCHQTNAYGTLETRFDMEPISASGIQFRLPPWK